MLVVWGKKSVQSFGLFISSCMLNRAKYIVITSRNPDFPKQQSVGILSSLKTFFFIQAQLTLFTVSMTTQAHCFEIN